MTATAKTKLIAALGILIAVLYCLVEAQGEGDFYIFMLGSRWMDGEANIYGLAYYGFHYYYSVLFALILKPFLYLPFYWVKFCWLLLNLSLYLHLFKLLAGSDVVRSLETKKKNWFLFFVFLFSFRFLHENIHASQITILILWCCVYGIYLVHSGNTVRGSLILALGINIKLLPLVLLPYLLYRGYFKALFITVSAYALSLWLPAVFIGSHYNMQLLQWWFERINPTNEAHVLDVDERSFHSLTTLLSTLFYENPPDIHAMAIKRNVASVSLETLTKIILFVRLALVGFTLYFLKLRTFARSAPFLHQLTELSYILLLVPLIFPHQQHYAFLFIVPAFALVLFVTVANNDRLGKFNRAMIPGILTVIYLACNLKILLGEFNKYYEHFKILTYGALLLVPILIWVSRQKEIINKV